IPIGEIVGTMENLGSAAHPVIHEDTLHLADNRAFNAEFRVTPVRVFGGVAEPFIRQTDPADKSDFSINDQSLAMGAMVPGPAIPRIHLVEDFQFDTGIPELLPVGMLKLESAKTVDDAMNLHPRPRAFRQRFDKLIAQRARTPDEILERDCIRRLANGLE